MHNKPMGQRSFLKWAGNKYLLIDEIKKSLPFSSGKFIEPFLGSGAVFLNTEHDNYLLNDINRDLINVFFQIKKNCAQFISDLKPYFIGSYNNEDDYYAFRETFNQTDDQYLKAILFVYLNRHGFQGLCRYNLKGGFNVPFGHYKSIHFPDAEIILAEKKVSKATFISQSFQEVFRRARAGDTIYCDPPYLALSKTACFTAYSKNTFSLSDHEKLVNLAVKASNRGVSVVISNHDTEIARRLYESASIKRSIPVRRSINAKSARNKTVSELLVAYLPDGQLS